MAGDVQKGHSRSIEPECGTVGSAPVACIPVAILTMPQRSSVARAICLCAAADDQSLAQSSRIARSATRTGHARQYYGDVPLSPGQERRGACRADRRGALRLESVSATWSGLVPSTEKDSKEFSRRGSGSTLDAGQEEIGSALASSPNCGKPLDQLRTSLVIDKAKASSSRRHWPAGDCRAAGMLAGAAGAK